LLGPLVAIGAPVPASMGVAAMFAAPASPAAAGQKPGEECVELRHPLLGNVDRYLLVLRGGGF
jgi:hypothetical protein